MPLFKVCSVRSWLTESFVALPVLSEALHVNFTLLVAVAAASSATLACSSEVFAHYEMNFCLTTRRSDT